MKSVQIKRSDLKEQLINSINDIDIMTKIICELSMIKRANEITTEPVLCWARRVDALRAQKAILEVSKESRRFDAVKRTDQQCISQNNTKRNNKVLQKNHRYCGTIHTACRCPVYGESCGGCGIAKQFESVCWR